MSLSAGTKLSRYEIRTKIGAGGMGEVYLAQDTKLDRKVALKILPANVADDRDRMNRFVGEAKAASALNHPNIITIHEIDQTHSGHFIATEFIDGETLRQRMKNAPMKLGEVLDVAIQSASALSAAHAAGIVHRDIKPENIMIRRDGIVKVLDFGLAKLTERLPPDSVDTEAPTSFKTDPGTVLGTVVYMSPEQARGLQVDARTDIFSLGVVLYEMVAGCLPFEGSTSSEVLASILSEKEPPPLARFARDVPAELERIVEKALRKDREERYQTAKDMLLDLRRLKRKLEVDAEIERTVPPELRSAADEAGPSGSQEAISTTKASPAQMTGVESTRTSSVEYLVTEIKRHKRGVVAILATIILLSVAGIAYYFYFARGVSRAAIDSIVVLPLVNASNDPNTEYLSDGISEALINSLTELQQLRVIARSTAFRYKGKDVDPQQVGRELNVQTVLMGRVRQVGDLLDVQVDLVDATTGAQLWGAEYERRASDVLSVKQTIAREVTEKLRLKLSGEEQQRLSKRDTTNSEAYQSYLRGRYYWNKRTADGLKRAIQEFQQATERDPNYALGYVGLADCYLLLDQYAGAATSETLPKAKAAVERALQIDDTLPEAHASMANVHVGQWQWATALAEFKRAVSLNPNYPTAHHWFAIYYVTNRQFKDALNEMKRAHELDPLSPIIGSTLAMAYLMNEDPASALAQCKKVIEIDPDFASAHLYLGWAYNKTGRKEEALAELQKAVELSGRASFYMADLGYMYAVAGKRREAIKILTELEDKYSKQEGAGVHVAGIYAGLGDKDHAFAWLEKDLQQRNSQLPDVAWWFNYEDLRSDPRYADLVRRMGLPQ